VTGAGADIWGSADAFRFAYQPLNGDGSIVARVASVQPVDVWTKAGVMVRESLAANARQASMFVSAAKGLAFQRRTTTGGTSTSTGAPGAAPIWVRMTRAGSTFTAAWSTDGAVWTTLGTDTIAMGASAYIGLAVTSHNSSQLAHASFDSVVVTGSAAPNAWSDLDIGSVVLAGSAAMTGSAATVRGAGADIWGTEDAFHFLYRRVTGDGEIVARVTSIGNTHAWAKAGVMIRDGTSRSATHASMFVSYGKGLAYQRRPVAAGTSVSTAGSLATAPRWVRLVRAGSTFTSYESADGVNWTLVGTDTIAMSADALWGLAVTSHNTSAICTATFEDVTIVQ
jgi:regulation of enolase protein 1 (concanavalin A-like superfamily)